MNLTEDDLRGLVGRQVAEEGLVFVEMKLARHKASTTLRVFADRQGIPVDEFYQLLNSEQRLEDELFSFVPRDSLVEYRDTVITDNLVLLGQYFSGTL